MMVMSAARGAPIRRGRRATCPERRRPPGFRLLDSLSFGSLLVGSALAVSVVLTGCAVDAYPDPPRTRTEVVADTLHGVVFEDPYRWLEDQDAPETREWVAAQNAYTEQVVGPSALRDSIAARYREMVDRPEVGRVRTEGEWQYFTLRRTGEEMEVLYRRPAIDSVQGEPTPEGTYETVLDPVDFHPEYRRLVSLREFSPDGSVMMYQIRDGGSDEIEIRFMDTETLEDLPDRLPRALYGGVRFIEDGAALEYTHRSREIGPRIKRHVMGAPMEGDETLWGEGYGPEVFIGVRDVDGGRLRIYTAQHGWAWNEVHLQRDGGPIQPLVTEARGHFDVEVHDGDLYLVTDWEAPLAKVLRVDPDDPDPSSWVTIIPEAERPLQDISFIEGRIYARYLDDVAHRIRVFEMDGTPAGEIDVPPYSSVGIGDAEGEGVLRVTVEGYVRPEVEYEVDLTSGEWVVTDSSDTPWDGSGFEVDQFWYTSADGTRAPMYVLRRQGIELDGSHPTILTGYGGFDVARMPGFSTTAALWLEMGGVYAVATLRGGSEYGEAWHRGGMLENKQNVFDDFIAAAELLISSGHTSPDHLGIWGTSNGGLLVASALTQRPDLFRAVYCGYPDLDMVRFHTFTENNNMPALLEYGDARNPAHFEAIRRYSPYQAVEDGVAYAAVMLTTGDLDTRVPPLQARKMTARLQNATSSGLPVVLWYDDWGGHAAGRGRPMSLRVEDTARELAFMAQQLGLVTAVTP